MVKVLRSIGVKSEFAYLAALMSIVASIGAWAASKQSEDRPHAERWGIFVGLWAPTFMEIGNALRITEES